VNKVKNEVKKTSISLDKELYEKLRDKAKEQQRSFSAHIAYIAENSKEATELVRQEGE